MSNQHPSRRTLLKGAAGVGIGGFATSIALSGSDNVERYPAHKPTVANADCLQPNPTKLDTKTTNHGTYFVDSKGRVVLLRGVNIVDKNRATPAFPPEEISDADIDRLAAWGFNFVRLGVQWAKLTPNPPLTVGNQSEWLDGEYLDRVHNLVRRFAKRGIYVLIDMHQDLYSHVFSGDGAPVWAVYDEGFPFVATDPWWTRYLQPAVLASFDNFWRNTADIQTGFARMWRAMAARFRDEPNVIGYDLFNEPAPGIDTITNFERKWVARFANRVIERIREVDPTTTIWVEPAIYFGGGVPSRLRGITDPADNLAFSFHAYPELALDNLGWLYTQLDTHVDIGKLGYQMIIDNAMDVSRRLAAPPVMTEFGAKQESSDIAKVVNLMNEQFVSWSYWQYKPWEGAPSGWLLNDGQVSENLLSLIQPHPQAIAGVPVECNFNRHNRTFRLAYQSIDNTSTETVLSLPDRVYGGDYTVSVDGGELSCRSDNYLRIQNTRPRSTVTVRISPT